MATVLTRSLSSTSTSWTFSAWVKKQQSGGYIMSWGNSGTDATGVGFSTDKFIYYSEDSPSNILVQTTALYRDVNGWYHVVCKCDAGAITLYVNGESAATGTGGNPLDTSTIRLGDWQTGSGNEFFGLVSHLHFIDGTAYDADSFGETDSTTGQWKINTSPSVTYGTNGFFMFKDDNSLNDDSGNGNNFTLSSGSLTQTEDNPSNVFATLNPLVGQVNDVYPYALGNTWSRTHDTEKFGGATTLGMSKGKYYAEVKLVQKESATNSSFGITGNHSEDARSNYWIGQSTWSYGYRDDGQVENNNVNQSGTWSTYTTGDIIGIAVDLDNNYVYFSKNGVWQNSGVPTSGATGTGGVAITSASSINEGSYFFAWGDTNDASSTTCSVSWNFGNGYFGGTSGTNPPTPTPTAISSEGTNASGLGKFEYDVPTGFTALCTKGLNE